MRLLFYYPLTALLVGRLWSADDALSIGYLSISFFLLHYVGSTRAASMASIAEASAFLSHFESRPKRVERLPPESIGSLISNSDIASYVNIDIAEGLTKSSRALGSDPSCRGVLVLFPSDKHGRPMASVPRAYVNGHGRSIIVLHRSLDRFRSFDEFCLAHELHHISRAGSWQRVAGNEYRITAVVTFVVIAFLAKDFIQVGIGAVLLVLSLTASSFEDWREAQADLGGLDRVAADKQLVAGEHALALFTDYACSTSPRIARHWSHRVHFLSNALHLLRSGQPIKQLHWGEPITFAGYASPLLCFWVGVQGRSPDIWGGAVNVAIFVGLFLASVIGWSRLADVNDLTTKRLSEWGVLKD